jgi:hypothetical protein
MQAVSENMHFGVVPRDELAVEPDVFSRSEPHRALILMGCDAFKPRAIFVRFC